jgi:chorismate mutase/prephenate dehydratase
MKQDKDPPLELDQLRQRIDAVDDELLSLLNRRAGLSLDIARLQPGEAGSTYKPFREKELLARLQARNSGPLPEPHLLNIYREILSSSRTLQRPQRVVYLGPEGTFSFFAARQHLGHSAVLQPKPNFEEIYRAVAEGAAELGVIPLENSFQGSVGQNLDLFSYYDVYIQAELYCRISHGLLARTSHLGEIKRLYSHPKAFEQCSNWVHSHLTNCPRIPAGSTAAAAHVVAHDDAEGAAIGNVRLAELFPLNVLADHLEDEPDNWTRFLVIGAAPSTRGHRDKTSLLFTTPNQPGALAQVLNHLAREGINLVKLESRPARSEKWKYVFFADLECDLNRSEYSSVLALLKQHCPTFRVLGCYPAAQRESNYYEGPSASAPVPGLDELPAATTKNKKG